MSDHEFINIQTRLEETLLKLRNTHDPNLRPPLLREMRRLLADADRVAHSVKLTLLGTHKDNIHGIIQRLRSIRVGNAQEFTQNIRYR
jgi:hypothetical protein